MPKKNRDVIPGPREQNSKTAADMADMVQGGVGLQTEGLHL